MTVINSNEFITNQQKYFDMAENEDICIKRGNSIFHLIHTTISDKSLKERVYYEPDEDFYKSISTEEFRKRLIEVVEEIDKKYAK